MLLVFLVRRAASRLLLGLRTLTGAVAFVLADHEARWFVLILTGADRGF